MSTVISVKGLTKIYKRQIREPGLRNLIRDFFNRRYEETLALDHISFAVEQGEIVGYIGPNGAGKTTTMKILSGILYPTEGEVRVLGFTPLERKRDFLKKITLVMGQKNQLWWDIPAMDSFLLFKEIYEVPYKVFQRQLGLLLEMLDAKELVHYPVRNLSMGERMKMELISALIHDPEVIFLDEPTIGLDVVSQSAIRKFLAEYNREFKKTIILTSHYMKDIEELATRVIFIMDGKIIYDGDIDTLISKTMGYEYFEVSFERNGEIVTESYRVKSSESALFLKELLNKNGNVVEIRHRKPDLEEVARFIMSGGDAEK